MAFHRLRALNSSRRQTLRSFSVSVLCLLSLIAGGLSCSPKEPKKPTVRQSIQHFEERCLKEFQLQVITNLVGNTLYVYLPTNKPFFDYEASKEMGNTQERKTPKLMVNYLDGSSKNKFFRIEYDITDVVKSKAEDYGYTSNYTESFQKQQNSLFTALEALLNSEADKNEVNTEFIVVIIADIVKGIENRSIFYVKDLKRQILGEIPYDEFMKRYLIETKGNQNIIGDEIGNHIDYVPVDMHDFLMKQIINRIQFKFQRSDFPPNESPDKLIGQLVADTLRYYDYQDYLKVILTDIRKKQEITLTPDDMAKFKDEVTKEPAPWEGDQKGKLIHVIFEDGKATIQEDKNSSNTAPLSNKDENHSIEENNSTNGSSEPTSPTLQPSTEDPSPRKEENSVDDYRS